MKSGQFCAGLEAPDGSTPTFNGLTAGTTYYFFDRVTGSTIYMDVTADGAAITTANLSPVTIAEIPGVTAPALGTKPVTANFFTVIGAMRIFNAEHSGTITAVFPKTEALSYMISADRAGKIKCGCCGYALTGINAPNGVTYLRCKQRIENKMSRRWHPDKAGIGGLHL